MGSSKESLVLHVPTHIDSQSSAERCGQRKAEE